MSMVKPLEFQEAVSVLSGMLSACFESLEEANPSLTQEQVNSFEHVTFRLPDVCTNDYFIREIDVYFRKSDNDLAFWEGQLRNKYVVSNIILIGPWECLDKFLSVAQREDNVGYVKFLLDGIDEGLLSEASSS